MTELETKLAQALRRARRAMHNEWHNKPRLGMESECADADAALSQFEAQQKREAEARCARCGLMGCLGPDDEHCPGPPPSASKEEPRCKCLWPPKPGEIHGFACPEFEPTPSEPKCRECGGSGWIPTAIYGQPAPCPGCKEKP